ncbi:MAG: MFS transporter [Phycisphaerales bacterium]|nr:MFS transporter [Phycisphaerales bacterium]
MNPQRVHGKANHATRAIHGITFLNSLATGVLWNGLGFITAREFHYSALETCLLFVATGAVYALAAFLCGRVLRRFEGRVSPRKMLYLLFVVQTMVAPLAAIESSSVGIIIVAIVVSITGACLWPIVESYVAAGRSAQDTRRAIGLWCLVWMPSVALALVFMAPLQRDDGWLTPRMALFAIAPVSLLSIVCLRFLPTRPAHHFVAAEAAPAVYVAQLQCVRILLPASYVLVGALSPLMPYLLGRLALDATSETPLAAVWLSARVVVVALMASLPFWHGRWSTLLLGSALLIVGFTLVVTLPTLATCIIGLIAFGLGHGMIYYAALYYALRVGSAQVDAGGIHEALIGLGYVIGPAAALTGSLLGGGGWTVAVMCGLMAIASIPAMRPWWKLRRASAKFELQGTIDGGIVETKTTSQ